MMGKTPGIAFAGNTWGLTESFSIKRPSAQGNARGSTESAREGR